MMWCCTAKKHECNIPSDEELEEIEKENKKLGKNGDIDKSKDKKENIDKIEANTVDNTPAEEIVESPINVNVTEFTESKFLTTQCKENQIPETNQVVESKELNENSLEKADNSRYVSQMSFSSSLSVREEINRCREQFFSYHSPNDYQLQEGNKRFSSTDEKFNEYRQRIIEKVKGQQVNPLGDKFTRVDNEEQVMSAEQILQAVSRLEAVTSRLESISVGGVKNLSASGGESHVTEVTAPFVAAFDDMLKSEFAKFMDLSAKIGVEVSTQADMVKASFQVLRDFLVIASKSKKPTQAVITELLNPLSLHLSSIQEFREKHRTSPMFNHLSGISESIPALGWVAVEPAPGPYVKEMQDAGMFYTNRVVKDFKDKDQSHVDWTKAWNGTLREMIAYIKEHHTTCVSWNPQGGDAKSVNKPAASPASHAGGDHPPPPPGPPPPPPPPAPAPHAGNEGPDVRAQLFAEINKGTAISSGLKKVTDDMKTHKNPALRAGQSPATSSHGVRTGPQPFKSSSSTLAQKSPAPSADKPPVLELQDKKWIVEYHVGNKGLSIEETNLKQTVYMYKCQDCTLQIKGKTNSITVDSCKKVAIVFDSVVSAIEFVNCQSVQAQVMGQCPTVSIDKTDGCMMYLSKEAMNAEIVTAKSSEMNILVPDNNGEYNEFPLPEQFKTRWNGQKFVTDITESI